MFYYTEIGPFVHGSLSFLRGSTDRRSIPYACCDNAQLLFEPDYPRSGAPLGGTRGEAPPGPLPIFRVKRHIRYGELSNVPGNAKGLTIKNWWLFTNTQYVTMNASSRRVLN